LCAIGAITAGSYKKANYVDFVGSSKWSTINLFMGPLENTPF
jgi:hypothetical protein